MNKYFGIIIFVICLLGFIYSIHPLGLYLTVRNHTFNVILAITEEEKQHGLGNRSSLDTNTGMLFLYGQPETHGFWMKNMKFPIDIIWIRDQTVVDVSTNVPVATTSVLPVYKPAKPVNKVFEVNAGTINRYNIQIGDTVQIHF